MQPLNSRKASPKRATEIGWLRLLSQNGVNRHMFSIHLQPGLLEICNPCLGFRKISIASIKSDKDHDGSSSDLPKVTIWITFESIARVAAFFVGQNSEPVSAASSSHISATISQARPPPSSRATHRGVGQTLQGILHNNGTLRARPCWTKKPGIQLMRLNAGRLGWKFWKVLVEADSSTILRWEWFLQGCKLPECTFLAFSGNVRLYWLRGF